jgi:phytoene dehydrogenase-like protein
MGMHMEYDAIIAGGGIAGLTAAAFLCKGGCSVLLCEQEAHPGGLVGSFETDGFTFDAGIRAMENSGVLFPMLKSLGLDIAFLKNEVSIGIRDSIVRLISEDSLQAYRDMLTHCFPKDAEDIDQLIAAVKRTMTYMDVLYGIDNPLFMNLKDRNYVFKTLLPWMFRYIARAGSIKKLNLPVEEYLREMIANPALRDMIAQHFFKRTPAFFALSYFSLYLDYKYPKGGTGALVGKLEAYILEHGGEIRTNARIRSVNPAGQTVTDETGVETAYRYLIWAADMKALYASVIGADRLSPPVRRAVREHAERIANLRGGDSVLTLYVEADLDPSYFGGIHSPHFFYTPEKTGLSAAPVPPSPDRDALAAWLQDFLRLTTYEISVPVLRDPGLAPEGKTGLIVSTLMDYTVVKRIEEQGWYDDFKMRCQNVILETLIRSIYPELEGKVRSGFVSTPLTIARRTGNTDGAITGWSFENAVIPAVSKMTQIAKSVKTPLPNVLQAGQWTYSPSGFPISILTGKMAADAVLRRVR